MFNTKVFDGVCINTAEGTYTFKDLIVYIRGNIHRWKDSPLVWDLTQFPLAEDAEPSAMIEQQLSGAKDLAEMRSNQRTAFVVTQDYAYGMFRMYCAFTECLKYPFEMRVFRSLSQAKAWTKGEL